MPPGPIPNPVPNEPPGKALNISELVQSKKADLKNVAILCNEDPKNEFAKFNYVSSLLSLVTTLKTSEGTIRSSINLDSSLDALLIELSSIDSKLIQSLQTIVENKILTEEYKALLLKVFKSWLKYLYSNEDFHQEAELLVRLIAEYEQ